MISGVLFDLNDTVLIADWERFDREMHVQTGISIRLPGRLKRQYAQDVVVGKRSMREILLELKEAGRIDMPLPQIVRTYAALYERFVTVDPDMVALVRKLKPHVFVAAVSNMNDLHVEINRERGVFDYFHKAYLSCEVGMAKPDERLLRYIAEEDMISFERLLFMDDNERNLEAAKSVGIKTVRFTTKENFLAHMDMLFPYVR